MAGELYTIEKELTLPERLTMGDLLKFQIVSHFSEVEDPREHPYVVTAAMQGVRDPQYMTADQVKGNPDILVRMKAPASDPSLTLSERFEANQRHPDRRPFQAFWEYVISTNQLDDLTPGLPAAPDRTQAALLMKLTGAVITGAMARVRYTGRLPQLHA